MKTIVTHIRPDLDACGSVWLIKRFLPSWKNAAVTFVSAGKTLEDKPVDENKEIIHVDTGMGKFDHHQTNEFTCATKKVYEYLTENNYIRGEFIEAVGRMVNFVNEIDHFQECFYPDPTSDRYEFLLPYCIDGLHQKENDQQTVEIVMLCLDGILQTFRNKIRAEEELKTAYTFESKWGKTLAIESKNEEVVKLAQKKGYQLVIRKDIKKGFLRLKAIPSCNNDLTAIYQKIKKLDKEGSWFLHASKNMLLNGSSKVPNAIPSKIAIGQIIEIVKSI